MGSGSPPPRLYVSANVSLADRGRRWACTRYVRRAVYSRASVPSVPGAGAIPVEPAGRTLTDTSLGNCGPVMNIWRTTLTYTDVSHVIKLLSGDRSPVICVTLIGPPVPDPRPHAHGSGRALSGRPGRRAGAQPARARRYLRYMRYVAPCCSS